MTCKTTATNQIQMMCRCGQGGQLKVKIMQKYKSKLHRTQATIRKHKAKKKERKIIQIITIVTQAINKFTYYIHLKTCILNSTNEFKLKKTM